MNNLYEFDKEFGRVIIGIDEAGRGPLAGPVVAAAVIIDEYQVKQKIESKVTKKHKTCH